MSYAVTESHDILDPLNAELASTCHPLRGEPTTVIVDDRIDALVGTRLRAYFAERSIAARFLVMESAEEMKTLTSVQAVARDLNVAGTLRATNPPIAIGGGAMLDVVGLAASLYRRGVPYVRVPTTLLGQVDVSVAAKTGINFDGYRNRLGSYTPPLKTVIDRSFLATLPRRQLVNGMGEILKMALVKDARLFEVLEARGRDLVDTSFDLGDVADEVIRRAITGMVEELAPNLWEKDLRRCVDYGHSFGPLVEMRALPELLHGEAVALDCLFSACLAVERGLLDHAEVLRIARVAQDIGLPVRHALFEDRALLWEALEDTVRHRDGNQHLPVLTSIGRHTFLEDVTPAQVGAASALMVDVADAVALTSVGAVA
ncbi:sedoheptulose 7-phosphate cyclase [Cellulomonas sp. P5_C5]